MILQVLADYYEELLKDGKTVPNGWCRAKASFALNLAEDREFKKCYIIKRRTRNGKENNVGSF